MPDPPSASPRRAPTSLPRDPRVAPFHDVDVAPDLLEELAWHGLSPRGMGRGHEGGADLLRALLSRAGVRQRYAEPSYRAWVSAGGALDVVRRGRVGPERRLTAEETEAFVAGCQGTAPLGRDDAWRVLVRAGFWPTEAARAVLPWTPSIGTLPDGEFLDRAMLVRHSAYASVRLPEGWIVGRISLQRALLGARSSPASAALRLRQELGFSLAEARRLVEDAVVGRLALVGVQRAALQAPGRSCARQRLDAARDSLLLERPLHWTMLAFALVREDATHPTMAVGLTVLGQVALFYNPDFVASLDDEQCRAVLEHEVNHVLFRHVGQGPKGPARHRAAWVLACECTANEFVRGPLPGRPVTCEVLGLPPHESTLQRYQLLKGLRHACDGFCRGTLSDSLAPNPLHHADVAEDLVAEPTNVAQRLVAKGAPLDADTALALRDHFPDELRWRELAATALDPEREARVPWRRVLHEMATSLRDRVATRRWPNRRAPSRIGIVPGRRRAVSEPVILVAIDTSGSMSRSLLSDVGAELTSLAKTGVRIAVVQCDTEIRLAEWLRDAPLSHLRGRGGTDLRPPFGPQVLRHFTPDAVIYFTDGHGPAPSASPAGLDVVWVLMGRGVRPATWGRVIVVQDKEGVTFGASRSPVCGDPRFDNPAESAK